MRLARRRRRAEVNIVPLVDVLVVLIFFFLMSMQFRNRQVLHITVPSVELPGRAPIERPVEVGIDAEGHFFYNGQEVQPEGLEAGLTLAAGLPAAPVVLVVADEDSALKHVTYVMDTCRRLGLEQVRLQTR